MFVRKISQELEITKLYLDKTNLISIITNKISCFTRELIMSTKYLQQNGGQIAYEDHGQGPLVICIPSIGDVRAEYRFLTPMLVEAGFRVVVMDVRGQGQSSPSWEEYSLQAMGRDLLALIQHLDAGSAFVLGTSMGAAAGIWAAAENPEQISSLVLIGPAVHGEVNAFNRLLYSILFARPWGPAFWVKYYSGLYTTRKPHDLPDYLNSLLANLREPGRIEAVLKLALAPKTESERRMPSVAVPVRVIMGSKDPDFKDPEAEAHWVASRLNAEYQIIPGAGHYPHAEMPEITSPLVIDFLKSQQKPEVHEHVSARRA